MRDYEKVVTTRTCARNVATFWYWNNYHNYLMLNLINFKFGDSKGCGYSCLYLFEGVHFLKSNNYMKEKRKLMQEKNFGRYLVKKREQNHWLGIFPFPLNYRFWYLTFLHSTLETTHIEKWLPHKFPWKELIQQYRENQGLI